MKILGLVCYVFMVLALFGSMLFKAHLGEWNAATFCLISLLAFDHYMPR